MNVAQLKQLLHDNAALVTADKPATVTRADGRFPDTFFTKGIAPFERYATYVVHKKLEEVYVHDAIANVEGMTETFKDRHGKAFGPSAKANYIAHLINALALAPVQAAMEPAHHAALLARWTELKNAATRQRPPRDRGQRNDDNDDDGQAPDGGETDPVMLFAQMDAETDEQEPAGDSLPAEGDGGEAGEGGAQDLQTRLDAALRRNDRLVSALEMCAATATPNEAAWIRHVMVLINDM